MLETEDVIELLRDNPKYTDILQRAVKVEEKLKEQSFLFIWEDISGESEGELKDFLYQQFYKDWIKDAIVSKPNQCEVYVQDAIDFSATRNWIHLELKKNREVIITLNISTERTCKLDAKQDGGKIKLYRSNLVMWEWHNVQAAPQ